MGDMLKGMLLISVIAIVVLTIITIIGFSGGVIISEMGL
jgi:hypothetical protein